LPFVCVPAGTRNHFALDLGVDRHDLLGALEAFTDGVERPIDAGSVNGRLFLNNVSLGIYGEAVRQPTYRDSKARTLVETARHVLGPNEVTPELHLADDEGRVHRNPAVVVVSNNAYALDRTLAPGTRPRLDLGRLGVIVLDAPGISPRSGRAWTAASVEVDGPTPVHAGIDGEAVELGTPLGLEILPGALRVRISARHPGVSPSRRLP
jgi:diacylglycerol kinase family enzyme